MDESRIHPQIQGEVADILMMKSPDHWPLDDALPLMNRTRGSHHEPGVMLASPDRRWTIWKTLMFDRRLNTFLATGEDGGMDHEDYDSAEAVFAAGWRVD
jgi:hypothetical protein